MTNKKIYVINGSPRKQWNTAQMCESFAKGAKDNGAEIEIIHLYDLDFKGCRSCFACKLKDGKNFGRCAYADELASLLDKISQADGIVLASPIYCGDVTGVMRCFIERLTFPFFEYKQGYPSIAPKRLKTAMIYTMNVTEELANQMYPNMFNRTEFMIETVFTKPERIFAYDTYQFNDYDKYVVETFDKNEKLKHKNEQFPKNLQKAYDEGVKMAKQILQGE